MRFNAHKEKIIFEKSKNNNVIELSSITPINVIEDIKKIYSNEENIYMFSSGDKASFVYNRSTVNDLSFNYFQIYNKSIYLCFKEIIKTLSKMLDKTEINKEKNIYYLTSEYEKELLNEYWYDTGGIGLPIFSGYWFLDVSEESYIKINDEKIKIVKGSLIIFQAGAEIRFFDVNKAISFNISTLNKIIGQYPQKWMPIVLS